MPQDPYAVPGSSSTVPTGFAFSGDGGSSAKALRARKLLYGAMALQGLFLVLLFVMPSLPASEGMLAWGIMLAPLVVLIVSGVALFTATSALATPWVFRILGFLVLLIPFANLLVLFLLVMRVNELTAETARVAVPSAKLAAPVPVGESDPNDPYAAPLAAAAPEGAGPVVVPGVSTLIDIEGLIKGRSRVYLAILLKALTIVAVVAMGEKAPAYEVVLLAANVGLGVLMLSGIYSESRGLGYDTGVAVLMTIGMFLPLANLFLLVWLDRRVAKTLRAAGYKIGFLGVKKAHALS